MTLSEDLVALFALLEDREETGLLFEDDALAGLQCHGEFHQVAERLSEMVRDPGLMVLLALRALANQNADQKSRLADVSLVATFPDQESADARHTWQVVREMIRGAREEILVAGFAISEGGGLIELLLESQNKVKRIAVICSDWRPDSGTDAVGLFEKRWPVERARPAMYQYNDSDGKTGMHIKCVIIDAREMLIGSANFTYSGMRRNFELGVRIRGEVVRSARGIFESFLTSKDFKLIG